MVGWTSAISREKKGHGDTGCGGHAGFGCKGNSLSFRDAYTAELNAWARREVAWEEGGTEQPADMPA